MSRVISTGLEVTSSMVRRIGLGSRRRGEADLRHRVRGESTGVRGIRHRPGLRAQRAGDDGAVGQLDQKHRRRLNDPLRRARHPT